MNNKDWFIEQSPFKNDYFIYTIDKLNNQKDYVLYEDFDGLQTFTIKQAKDFIEKQVKE